MYFFRNDYAEGALPEVMAALSRTNDVSTAGYGEDSYCQEAAEAIRTRFACPDADVHFLVGGTQTNQLAIGAFLRPWEAVISTEVGHVAVHETGAIEATGHKVCTVPSKDGKIAPEQIAAVYEAHDRGQNEHMVLPKLVYLSNSTELGAVYSRRELRAISDTCRQLGMYLYLDGARLAVALDAGKLEPEDLANFCDAFYIGGTKNGLLFGEALVITRENLKPNFRHAMKQRGAMLAKGRLLGVQFAASFEQDLWLKSARHANETAKKLRDGLKALGISLVVDTPTNQIFPILPNEKIAALNRDFSFEIWGRVDEHRTAVRFVTSWATEEASVCALLEALKA